jgi:DNA-binding XRE family transcriptional regulator
VDKAGYKPVRYDHAAFLKKARKRRGFKSAYQALAVEYAVANEMLAARARAGLTQEVVASRMGTSKSTVSRLESAGRHAPTLASLKKYAKAVGCKVEIRLVPQR